MTEDILPKGVTLRDPADFQSLRRSIYDGARDEMAASFPLEHGGVRIELTDVDYDGPTEFDLHAQKKALLEDRTLAGKLRGTVTLYDQASGEKIEEQRMSLMRVPYLTERGTFINNGSEYTTSTQARLLPGVYTRRQSNGQLETQFNPKPGTGQGFRVTLDPESAQYRLKIKQSGLHLYSLLKDMGVPDDQMRAEWGDEIFERNKGKYDARVLEKTYQRLVSPRDQIADAPIEAKVAAIKKALDTLQVHERVTKKHLPNMFSREKSAEWRARWEGICVAEAEIQKGQFNPDLRPSDELVKESAAFTAEFDPYADTDWLVKAAVAEFEPPPADVAKAPVAEFEPTLSADDVKPEIDNLYGRAGPRLAGLKAWPARWFPPGADALGWLSWYRKYAHGSRTEDDARQIQRWKSFKARTVPQFLRQPTPRRAFALRQWAIDPIALLPDEAQRAELAQAMSDYKTKVQAKALSKSASFQTEELVAVAQFLNRELQAGIDLSASNSQLEHAIMAFITDGEINSGLLSLAVDQQKSAKIADLIQAKKHSDRGQFSAKAAIMYGLMTSNPEEFEVDDAVGDYRGVTHRPTGFRMHLPANVIPYAVASKQTKAAEAVEWDTVEKERQSARADTEEPSSPEQTAAGNYRKGSFRWNGMELVLENPKGSVRKGKSKSGVSWKVTMKSDYGYVRKTVSKADGDAVDVFIGPDLSSPIVWVIDQYMNGKFDEHKVMVGYRDEDKAVEAYNANYTKGWKGCKSVRPLTIPQFKAWATRGDTGKPLADQNEVELS